MMNPLLRKLNAGRPGIGAALRRALTITVMATIAINTPGIAPAVTTLSPPDVLMLQGAVARIGGQGDRAAEYALGGVLELQRALASSAESGMPEEHVADAPAFWATVPATVSAAHGASVIAACTRAEPGGRSTARPHVLSLREMAPKRSPARERYLYHLTANAPPVLHETSA